MVEAIDNLSDTSLVAKPEVEAYPVYFLVLVGPWCHGEVPSLSIHIL